MYDVGELVQNFDLPILVDVKTDPTLDPRAD
jgi:hypothetical protein